MRMKWWQDPRLEPPHGTRTRARMTVVTLAPLKLNEGPGGDKVRLWSLYLYESRMRKPFIAIQPLG